MAGGESFDCRRTHGGGVHEKPMRTVHRAEAELGTKRAAIVGYTIIKERGIIKGFGLSAMAAARQQL